MHLDKFQWVLVFSDACGPFGWRIRSLICRFTVLPPFLPFLSRIPVLLRFSPTLISLSFSPSWMILRVHFPVLGLKLCILPFTSPASTASVSEHLALIAEGGSFRHLPAEVWSACFVCGQFSAALLKPPTLLICGTQRPGSPCWDTQELGDPASEEYV